MAVLPRKKSVPQKENEVSKIGTIWTIQTGASWSIDRVNTAYPNTPNICPLRQRPANKWHTFWTCPILQDSQAPYSLNSHFLKEQLIESIMLEVPQPTSDSLWLRRLITLMDTTPEYNTTVVYNSKNPNNPDPLPEPGEWPSGFYFGDGSGESYSAYPTLRRCEVGVRNLYQVPYKQSLDQN